MNRMRRSLMVLLLRRLPNRPGRGVPVPAYSWRMSLSENRPPLFRDMRLTRRVLEPHLPRTIDAVPGLLHAAPGFEVFGLLGIDEGDRATQRHRLDQHAGVELGIDGARHRAPQVRPAIDVAVAAKQRRRSGTL